MSHLERCDELRAESTDRKALTDDEMLQLVAIKEEFAVQNNKIIQEVSAEMVDIETDIAKVRADAVERLRTQRQDVAELEDMIMR
jgi:hypothetical protein